MHPLLEKQLKQVYGDNPPTNSQFEEFFQLISNTYQEITSHSATENYAQELEKKNKELEQFAYIVSHDLKAPLRGISNISTWIEEDLEGMLTDDIKTNLNLLKSRVKRMENLIDGILEYSRAGRIKQNAEPIDTNSLVQEIIKSLQIPAHFQVSVQPNLPTINAQKTALEQIFSNLISNAIKYNNSDAPLIKINATEHANEFEFCIEDNGNGIAKEFHDKVFIIFQTLQSRDKFESTGVGLAIVKKIIEQIGGKVWLDSEVGQFCKFYFTWPK